MGWRSWNAFGNNINRTIIDNNLAALTAKIWKVHGSDAFMSLADMGYNDFGIGIVQRPLCADCTSYTGMPPRVGCTSHTGRLL